MKLLAMLSCLVLVGADDPTVYLVRGVPHYREVLMDIPAGYNVLSSSLSIDYNTNDLYIAQYNRSPAILKLDTKELKRINGVASSQWITLDPVKHEAYIGTDNGIYKYSQDEVQLVGAEGIDIFKIYFKDILYYRKFLSFQLYTFVDGQSAEITDLDTVYNFIVDDDDNIIYTEHFGIDKLYSYNKDTEHKKAYKGQYAINSLAKDKNGKVYFATNDGVYAINKDDATIEKIADIDKPSEIAFDNENNIIYVHRRESKLYRLRPIALETTTDVISSTIAYNDLNKQSDDIQLVVTSDNNTDTKTDLDAINKKIDALPQIISILLSNALQKELHLNATSPGTVHLDNVIFQNVNISIGLDNAGTGQIVRLPPHIGYFQMQ